MTPLRQIAKDFGAAAGSADEALKWVEHGMAEDIGGPADDDDLPPADGPQ